MMTNIFPFKDIDDDEFIFLNSQEDIWNEEINLKHNESTNLEFKTFKFSDCKSCDFSKDIDPENNFLNTINLNCNYFTESDFVDKTYLVKGLKVIHFNARSLKSNFESIKHYLSELKCEFEIIAISETWLHSSILCDFSLEGYDAYHSTRETTGGGVALFVKTNIECKILKSKSVVIDELFECITVELSMAKRSNIIVNCMYRKPGSDIDVFLDYLQNLYSDVKTKTLILCGDFNIDLLKCETHNGTIKFLDTLYSTYFT